MNSKIEIRSEISSTEMEIIHDYISNRSYWGKGRSFEHVRQSIEQSICFGAHYDRQFAGFTRVVSDRTTFAYILDLFVLEDFRNLKISRALVKAMLSHPNLQTVGWMLGTNDAHGLYEKYGFQTIEDPNRYMVIPRPNEHP